ncbi:MAG TPA: hypothetical protein VMT61_16220 [Candidatus Binataceae bacterium]|nr:hypothetical protein [Candidatus Binataceae bacterium]
MPPFVRDIWAAFSVAWNEILVEWAWLQPPTKVLLVLALIGMLIFSASRSENTGVSTVIFLGCFGLFAYVFVIGYSLIH